MISANIVVKNEGEYLDRCLTQVNKLADEILIVDNGSEDNTMDIIRKHDLDYLIKTNMDIADIRNLLLRKSKGDWVWIVDGDEIYTDDNIYEIKPFLETPYRALGFRFKHFVGDEHHIAVHQSETIRMARLTPDLHWSGSFPNERLIDEKGWICSRKAIAARRDDVICTDIAFLHYGGIKKRQWRDKQPAKFTGNIVEI